MNSLKIRQQRNYWKNNFIQARKNYEKNPTDRNWQDLAVVMTEIKKNLQLVPRLSRSEFEYFCDYLKLLERGNLWNLTIAEFRRQNALLETFISKQLELLINFASERRRDGDYSRLSSFVKEYSGVLTCEQKLKVKKCMEKCGEEFK